MIVDTLKDILLMAFYFSLPFVIPSIAVVLAVGIGMNPWLSAMLVFPIVFGLQWKLLRLFKGV